jgi:hypothetical protein
MSPFFSANGCLGIYGLGKHYDQYNQAIADANDLIRALGGGFEPSPALANAVSK